MNRVPKNIIVRFPNWLGDAVMATPILKDLKMHWPEVQITALAQSGTAQLIEQDPYVDKILPFNKPKGLLNKLYPKQLIGALKEGKYDLGILLTNSFSSAAWFRQAGIESIGFRAHYRSPLLSHGVDFPKNKQLQHLVLTYKQLLTPLGLPSSITAPHLYLSEEEDKGAHHRLEAAGVRAGERVIGINPGAAYGSAKCWPPERFRALTEKLLTLPDVRLIFFGDPTGAPLVHQICEGFPERVINLAASTSIRELIALIKACDTFLTNDSGPMHIAAAVGTPLVAIFGSTSAVATGPYNHGTVIHKHVACSPCYKRTCPIDFRCMKQITADEVFDELCKQIQ